MGNNNKAQEVNCHTLGMYGMCVNGNTDIKARQGPGSCNMGDRSFILRGQMMDGLHTYVGTYYVVS